MNPDEFCGPGFQSGYDPLWVDLLAKHAEQCFHLLVGGGDQIYCDGCAIPPPLPLSLELKFCSRVAGEPELQVWINHPNRQEKMQYPVTQEMLDAIDRFYFNHYCISFRSGAFARASSSMYVCFDQYLVDVLLRFVSKPDGKHARLVDMLHLSRAVSYLRPSS